MKSQLPRNPKHRLENGQIFDENYFEHLLDEIREIRARKGSRITRKDTEIAKN